MGAKQIPWTVLSTGDLRAIAATASIAGRSRMRRSELLHAIHASVRRNPGLREHAHRKISERRATGKGDAPSSNSRAPSSGSSLATPGEFLGVPSPEPAPPCYHDRGLPIPKTYGDDRLRVMIRDPCSAYTYWELAGDRMDRLRLAYGDDLLISAPWCLRVHSVLSRSVVDIEVEVQAYRAYVRLQPGEVYRIALGFFDAEQRFVDVVWAGLVRTPIAGPSPVTDDRWHLEPGHVVDLTKPLDHARMDAISPSSIWDKRFGSRGPDDAGEME
ncbi:DUF4912 domain-containing protein [Candidatus Fermentibacteria bacterium]|nr:DUF4912 domain-containing protein [Candidatus Fermentibacteria bacterium]